MIKRGKLPAKEKGQNISQMEKEDKKYLPKINQILGRIKKNKKNLK